MNIEILDFKGPVDEQEILRFENDIGVSLPSEYREFLSTYNGGYPQPDAFSFGQGGDGSSIDRFLSLGVEKSHDLRVYLKRYEKRIPSGFLAIAHDPGGNLVIMDIASEAASIYFWDHENESEEGDSPSMNNVFFISKTFGEFISNLYEIRI